MKYLSFYYYTSAIIIIFSLFATSCNKKSNPPELDLALHPSAGSVYTPFTLDVSDSRDDEDNLSDLQIRMDWHDDGVWESDWTSIKTHSYNYELEGDYGVRVEIKDSDGQVTSTTENLTVTNSINVIPANSPFSYNVGINYDSWNNGRDNMKINDDLDEITKYFKLIKTYYAAGVGTTNVEMDPTNKQVIDYLVANIDRDLEMGMGTNLTSLVINKNGIFTPGFMTTKSYTDEWVNMLISAFGTIENVNRILKVIYLGNEIEQHGPPPNNISYENYYSKWIPLAFDNLQASMKEAGLDNIPITTIFANYPYGELKPDDSVQTHVTKHIIKNWSASWNSSSAFCMFNQYTGNYGKSTDFGHVIKYIDSLDLLFNGIPEVFVGETGYSAEFGSDNQVKVIKQMFQWMEGQYQQNKLTIPLFVFMAFDKPAKKEGQRKMGIFSDDANNKPTGLKPNIVIPDWVGKKKG